MTPDTLFTSENLKFIQSIAKKLSRHIRYVVPADDLAQYGAIALLKWLKGPQQCNWQMVAKRGMIDGIRSERHKGKLTRLNEVPYTPEAGAISSTDKVSAIEAAIDVRGLNVSRFTQAAFRRANGDTCMEIAADEGVNESRACQIALQGIKEMRKALGL